MSSQFGDPVQGYMGASDELIQKARQHAQRKFVMEMERIVIATQEELARRRNEMSAAGTVLSGAMWKVTADIYKRLIEGLIAARLKILLDAYELYGVPLDSEIEKEVLQDVSDLRETQIRNANQATSGQPWLRAGASTYISGELSRIPDPFNAVKVEVEERRHKKVNGVGHAEVTPSESLIFVSCGQSTPAERQLGQSVAKLIEENTGCKAYFAQNQMTFEGVTENILKRLKNAVGFIAIMHPRGEVSNPTNTSEGSWVRGSVWVEQEIAVAAFVSQALERPIQVRVYIHENIRREGLRDKLHLNPESFREDSEIIANLKTILPSWATLKSQGQKKDGLSLLPIISSMRVPVPGGGDDQRYMLMVGVENVGELDATDFTLDVEFPENLLDEAGLARIPSGKPGILRVTTNNEQARTKHLYPTSKFDNLISFHYAILAGQRGKTELLQQEVKAIVCSPSMKPKVATKRIAELVARN